jgi:hypothetical protein
MKTKFTSNASLSHAWANQLQDHGRTENMFFENDTIYSYGRHYIIGKQIISNNNQRVVFINTNGYSNTTAKQTNHVFRAIPDGIEVFNVPFKYSDSFHIEGLPLTIEVMIKDVATLINKQISAKSSFYYFIDAKDKYEQIESICNLFELQIPKKPENWEAAQIKSEYLKETVKERENAKQQKQILKDQELLQKWLNHEYNGQLYNIPVYLRISKDGQLIETTKGAKVSKIEALKLLSLIRSGNDIKGHKIDGFTVIENNINDIKIGCHTITWEKINNSKIFN